jgi:hypothetical protein
MSELRHLRESLQQMNGKLLAFDKPHGITERSISGVIELTGAYFPLLLVLVVVGVRCVSRCDKDFQFTGIFVGVAHGASCIDLRLRGRDCFIDFFDFASPSARFLLGGLAVAHVFWFGSRIAHTTLQCTAQKRSTRCAKSQFQTGDITNVVFDPIGWPEFARILDGLVLGIIGSQDYYTQ